MARIVIKNLEKSVETADFSHSILSIVQKEGIDWMHACGGKGRCTTCKTIVLQGENNLGPFTPAELKYQKQGLLHPGERLACQAKICGDVTLKVPEEGKLPHLIYQP